MNASEQATRHRLWCALEEVFDAFPNALSERIVKAFAERYVEQIEERSRKMHALALEALRKLTSAERRAIGYVAIHGNLWDLTWEARKPAQEAPQPQPVVPCRRDPETCSCDQHVGKPGNVWDGK